MWEDQGGELGVGVMLLGNDSRGRESRLVENPEDGAVPDAVQGCVAELEGAWSVTDHAEHRGHVVVDDRVVALLAGFPPRHVGTCYDLVVLLGDLYVGGGPDLAPVTQVHFVAVLLRRILDPGPIGG